MGFSLWHRIKTSKTFIKWSRWEFYPMYLTNIPVVLFWIYFSIRARSLFFFSNVNPAIETGGMFGESKFNILKKFPEKNTPISILVKKSNKELSKVLLRLKESQLEFPLICKPDIGCRGFLVKKVNDEQALASYIASINADFIIQEYISLPEEVGIFYHKQPGHKKGKISSICLKKMLYVTGDGVHDIAYLLNQNPRGILQQERLSEEDPSLLLKILKKGEIRLIEPIGNHSRGTAFLNGNHLISPKITAVFDQLLAESKGMFYGRFDIKCKSLEHLSNTGEFTIIEYNGACSEATHIYDPSYPIGKAYRDIYRHWDILFNISKKALVLGFKPMGWSEATKRVKDYLRYKKTAVV